MLRTRSLYRSICLMAVAGAVFASEVAAQDLHPSRRPSPVGIAKTHIGETYVKVIYGRPYMRNRDIFGASTESETYLVPFGQIWRTGANEATEITLAGPLMVAGQRLEQGTYAIFTVPSAASWAIHFSPQLGLDGTARMDAATGQFTPNAYDPGLDVLVIDVPSGALDEEVDQFTIAFEAADEGAHMVFRWERTEVRVPLALPSG